MDDTCTIETLGWPPDYECPKHGVVIHGKRGEVPLDIGGAMPCPKCIRESFERLGISLLREVKHD